MLIKRAGYLLRSHKAVMRQNYKVTGEELGELNFS